MKHDGGEIKNERECRHSRQNKNGASPNVASHQEGVHGIMRGDHVGARGGEHLHALLHHLLLKIGWTVSRGSAGIHTNEIYRVYTRRRPVDLKK